jgi:hypothetical protein
MKNNTLFIIFIISMVLVSLFALAYRFGYTMPDWVAFGAIVVTCVNCFLFGCMVLQRLKSIPY